MLSTKKAKEAYVEAVVAGGAFRFALCVGRPADIAAAKRGTKSGESGTPFLFLMSGSPMPFGYLRSEAKAGRMGARVMAIVAEGDPARVYLTPTKEHEVAASRALPRWTPDAALPGRALGFRVQEHGMNRWRDPFTPRQLMALATYSALVSEVRGHIVRDAVAEGIPADRVPLRDGGKGTTAYAEAVGVYLVLAIDRLADPGSSISTWDSTRDNVCNTFGRQAFPMTWDYTKAKSLSSSTGNWMAMVESVCKCVEVFPADPRGVSVRSDASTQVRSEARVVWTDPPTTTVSATPTCRTSSMSGYAGR